MEAPQYIYLAVFPQCLAADIYHYKQPVKTEKKNHITIFKRGSKDNEK
jgi:hypothetical protein